MLGFKRMLGRTATDGDGGGREGEHRHRRVAGRRVGWLRDGNGRRRGVLGLSGSRNSRQEDGYSGGLSTARGRPRTHGSVAEGLRRLAGGRLDGGRRRRQRSAKPSPHGLGLGFGGAHGHGGFREGSGRRQLVIGGRRMTTEVIPGGGGGWGRRPLLLGQVCTSGPSGGFSGCGGSPDALEGPGEVQSAAEAHWRPSAVGGGGWRRRWRGPARCCLHLALKQ